MTVATSFRRMGTAFRLATTTFSRSLKPESHPTPESDTILSRLFEWRPSTPSAMAYGLLFAASVMYFSRTTRFLYFQF